MADWSKRTPDNAPGPFFVDSTCIDCATCWEIAPAVFQEAGDHSMVFRQPETPEERRRAFMALVACPTASIGTHPKADAREGVDAFPEPIAETIYFCGYTSEDSFGAWSWLIARPEGNVLIDSPRAAEPLLKKIEAMGGVKTMILTHRDDVADHEAIRRRFGCERVMHADDSVIEVERKISGSTRWEDFHILPTPGHTRGHVVILYRNTYLFSGDHLAWSPEQKRLIAFRDATWYSWEEQIRSMESLLDCRFEWVLPGHGRYWHAPSAEAMHDELKRCIAWMKAISSHPR
jgi:glyoxylase-like metal-dependent hydrolase (beta-lactamase superfamily II)